MTIDQWDLSRSKSVDVSDLYLLRIEGTGEDIKKMYKKYEQFCSIPFAVKGDTYSWGIYFTGCKDTEIDALRSYLADITRSGTAKKKKKQTDNGVSESPPALEVVDSTWDWQKMQMEGGVTEQKKPGEVPPLEIQRSAKKEKVQPDVAPEVPSVAEQQNDPGPAVNDPVIPADKQQPVVAPAVNDAAAPHAGPAGDEDSVEVKEIIDELNKVLEGFVQDETADGAPETPAVSAPEPSREEEPAEKKPADDTIPEKDLSAAQEELKTGPKEEIDIEVSDKGVTGPDGVKNEDVSAADDKERSIDELSKMLEDAVTPPVPEKKKNIETADTETVEPEVIKKDDSPASKKDEKTIMPDESDDSSVPDEKSHTALPADGSGLDVPGKEDGENKIPTFKETQSVETEPASARKNTIRLAVLVPKDNAALGEKCFTNMKDNLDKLSKGSIDVIMSLQAEIDPNGFDPGEIFTVIKRAEPDMVFFAGLDNASDFKMNRLVSSLEESKINFYAIPKKEIDKKYTYLGMAVEFMLRVKKKSS